jgi:ABC-type transporter Mla subunit MlaD
MQVEQIRERFSRIEEWLDDAAQACRESNTVPDALRNCLDELDRESDQAKHLVETENDQERIRQSVEKLEAVGDRAMQACRQARNLDQKLQVSLSQAHFEISKLKQQLH